MWSLYEKGVYFWKPAVMLERWKEGSIGWEDIFSASIQAVELRIWVAADPRNKTTEQIECRKTGDRIFCMGPEAEASRNS